MSVEIKYTVMSPEVGVEKSEQEFPPGMGGAPSAMGRRPSGTGATTPSSAPFARRPDTLENKTVYLVDIGFGGGYNFMLQLQKWFAEHMPSVTTIRKRKPGNVFMDDNNSLWEEVREKGDAVVLGVAG
jgi:hypothetical protein